MGCDYYTWIETVILWKDLSGNTQTYTEKPEFEEYDRHYCYDLSYDSDFENPPSINDILYDRIEQYGIKEMFSVEKGWLCNENGKQRIFEILEEQAIPVENLVRVYKRMNGRLRC